MLQDSYSRIFKGQMYKGLNCEMINIIKYFIVHLIRCYLAVIKYFMNHVLFSEI